MVAAINEKFPERKGERRGERVYLITGTSDKPEALTLLRSTAPTQDTDGGVTLVRDDTDVDKIAPDAWLGRATYRRPDRSRTSPLLAGEFDTRFQVTARTIRITQALEHVASYAPEGQTPENYQGAIGVDKDGNVQGADIVIPHATFQEQHILTTAQVTQAYGNVVYELTGKTNDGPFRGLTAGEVLFTGAAGKKRNDDEWAIDYTWAVSFNVFGKTFGAITNVDIGGWHHVWVRYKEAVGVNFKLSVPAEVHVERIYEEGDFDALLI